MVFGASLQQHEGEVVAGDISAAAEGAADLDVAAAGRRSGGCVGQVARLDNRPVQTALGQRVVGVAFGPQVRAHRLGCAGDVVGADRGRGGRRGRAAEADAGQPGYGRRSPLPPWPVAYRGDLVRQRAQTELSSGGRRRREKFRHGDAAPEPRFFSAHPRFFPTPIARLPLGTAGRIS
jgi:hypothetical protein